MLAALDATVRLVIATRIEYHAAMGASTIPGYLTAAEAAKRLAVHPATITRYVASGRLPALRIGQVLLIREESFVGFEKPAMGNPRHREEKRKV